MLCYSLGEMKTNLFSFNLCSKFVFILRVNAWLSIISRTNYIHRYAQAQAISRVRNSGLECLWYWKIPIVSEFPSIALSKFSHRAQRYLALPCLSNQSQQIISSLLKYRREIIQFQSFNCTRIPKTVRLIRDFRTIWMKELCAPYNMCGVPFIMSAISDRL